MLRTTQCLRSSRVLQSAKFVGSSSSAFKQSPCRAASQLPHNFLLSNADLSSRNYTAVDGSLRWTPNLPLKSDSYIFHSQLLRPMGSTLQLQNILRYSQQQQSQQQRWMSSDSKNGKDEKPATPKSDGVASEATSNAEVKVAKDVETPKLKEGVEAVEGRIHAIVDSVGPTLRRVSSEWNSSDLLSVYGIVALIAIIVAAPIVVRHMRRSDSTYEDLDPEDPVADLAKMVRDEYQNEKAGHTSSPLALDSILSEVIKSKQFQEAVAGLVTQVVESPQFKKACQVLLKELWNDLIQDPETTAQVIHLLYNAIQDERIKEAAVQLVMEVVNDKEVLDELVILLQRLGNEKEVQKATQALLVESAHSALNDPEILDHSMEFATDVVGDDVVQRTAGEALYNTLSYAVRPTLSVFLSVLGAGLIVLSVAAFRNANSPEQELDRALSKTLETLESGSAAAGFSKILSLPLQLLAACKDAVVSIAMLPFRLVHGSVTTVGRASTATLDAISSCLRWIMDLPANLANSLVAFLGKYFEAISSGMSDRSRRAVEALTASFLGVFARNMAAAFTNTSAAVKAVFASIGFSFSQGAAFFEGSRSQGAAFFERIAQIIIQMSASAATKTKAGMTSIDNVIISVYEMVGHKASAGLSVTATSVARMGERLAELLSQLRSYLSMPNGGLA